jgi:hypothetical protein
MNSKVVWLLSMILLASVHLAEAQHPKKMPRMGYFTLSAGPSERDEAF